VEEVRNYRVAPYGFFAEIARCNAWEQAAGVRDVHPVVKNIYEKGSQETALPLTAIFAVSDLLPSKPTSTNAQAVFTIRRILTFPFYYLSSGSSFSNIYSGSH